MPRVLVTVDGLDGSGKSMLAERLAAACGRAPLISVDDFRLPVDWKGGDRSELALFYDERYDFAGLERCLTAFLEGADGCEYRPFDGAREALDPPRRLSFTDARTLVVEGVFVGRVPSAARGLAIYLDIPREEARRRLIERDVSRGRAPQEVLRRIDVRYFPAQERYHTEHRPRERAAVVVDNSDPRKPRLLKWAPRDAASWAPELEALRQVLEG